MTAALGLQIVDAKIRYSSELEEGSMKQERGSVGGMGGMRRRKRREVHDMGY